MDTIYKLRDRDIILGCIAGFVAFCTAFSSCIEDSSQLSIGPKLFVEGFLSKDNCIVTLKRTVGVGDTLKNERESSVEDIVLSLFDENKKLVVDLVYNRQFFRYEALGLRLDPKMSYFLKGLVNGNSFTSELVRITDSLEITTPKILEKGDQFLVLSMSVDPLKDSRNCLKISPLFSDSSIASFTSLDFTSDIQCTGVFNAIYGKCLSSNQAKEHRIRVFGKNGTLPKHILVQVAGYEFCSFSSSIYTIEGFERGVIESGVINSNFDNVLVTGYFAGSYTRKFELK